MGNVLMSGPNTTIQYSFATGVVAPGVQNRRDWARIDAAIAEGVNGTVGPTGGFRKRPGARFINECLHDDKPITQVTFEFSKEQVYELEFGDYQMRFYYNRGLVLKDDGTPYVLATPFSAGEAAELTYAQERDAMFFAHWDKPLKRLVRYGHNNWVWSDVFAGTDGRIASPSAVMWYDDASDGHNGYEYTVTAYKIVSGTPQESIGYTSLISDPNTVDFIPESPQNNILSCAAWIEKHKAKYGNLSGFPTFPAEFNFLGIEEDADPSGGQYLHPKILGIFKLQYPSASFGYRDFYYTETGSGGGRYRVHWGIYRANASSQTDYLWNAYYGQITGTGFDLNAFYIYPEYVSTVAAYNYTWFMRDTALGWINNDEVSVNGQTKTSIYNGITAFVNAYNQAHSAKQSNHIKWPAVSGASGYYVYRRKIGDQDKGFYQIATINSGATTHYLEPNVKTTVVQSKSPIVGTNDFNSPDRYPALVTFFQQRLVIGCTKEKPTTIFGSRTGIYTDFSIDPTDLSSGYEFKMASKNSNPLEAILPLYTLAVLTSGGDFISTVSGAMNAGNVNFNQKSYNGCSKVTPIIIGDSGLYVPLNQQTIKAMMYSYEKDGFAHSNIIFHAMHYTKDKKVIGLAYQRDPVNLIWALLDDGTLLSCTYIPEQDFQAWTEHHTQGVVKSINTVPTPEGTDEIYLVVERILGNGVKKQYLEVLEDMRPYGKTPDALNSFFVDCGLTGEFEQPTTIITGLEHLEGLEVAILADNSVLDRQSVVSGQITLERAARIVHVGLPYESHMKTLDMELMNQGTLRNTRRQPISCTVELEDTRELWWSANGGEENELTAHGAEEMGLPLLRNGDYRLLMNAAETRGSYLRFSSKDPVPMSIMSIVAEIDHGDS